MKYTPLHTLFFLFVFCSSCSGQNNPENSTDSSRSAANDLGTPLRSHDPSIHTKYEYTDASGERLIIQNGLPRGGTRYTDPDGEEYGYAIFWTRIINETDQPLELKIDFSDTYEVPDLPGKYFKLVVLPDTMTMDKTSSFNFGLTALDTFLNKNIHKPTSLIRTVNPKESTGFYVMKLSLRNEGTGGGGGDILRTGLILKGQELFYRASRYHSTEERRTPSLVGEKEIDCGSINLKNLVLQK